jgi:hypothetical protein
MSETAKATVVSEPDIFEMLGYPESILGLQRFMRTPGLEKSQTQLELAEVIASNNQGSHLSRRSMIDTIRRILGSLGQEKVGEEAALIEVLALDVHIPNVEGAQGSIATESRYADKLGFQVSLLGSGGSGRTTVSFSESDRLVAFRCTRKAYFSVAVLDILEITRGPDCGRRFAKLARVDNQISKVQTRIPQPDNCGQIGTSQMGERKEFDYRVGAVKVDDLTLEIETTDDWHFQAGIKLPNFGISADLEAEVERSRAITISYSLPGGQIYTAFREAGSPIWYWA